MALSQDCVLTSISNCLELPDLCSLEAASSEISKGMADFTPQAWIDACNQEFFSVTNVDKASIKSLLGAVEQFDHTLHEHSILMTSQKEVQSFVKAFEQVEKKKSKHLQSGGASVNTFVGLLRFSDENVQSYLDNPQSTVSCVPLPIEVGDEVFDVTLSWSNGTMCASARPWNISRKQPKEIGLHVRAVSSPLTMHKDFILRKAEEQQRGTGLCYMPQKSAAFAAEMKKGILVVGLGHDLKGCEVCSTAEALQLENPTWKCPEPVLI